MTTGKKPYSILQLASAVIMILLLMWLTVSTPFVYASQQELAKSSKSSPAQAPLPGSEEENSNPFGNNSTEEKTPKNISSVSEEYLHDHLKTDYLFSITLQYHKIENAGTYIAFHGELLVPPPNVL